MNVFFHIHSLDAEYAALPDADIEALWLHAVAHDREAREPLLRQLVLRAAHVIDETCRREGAAAGFGQADIERAYDESALRLMSRLRVDAGIRDVRAVAHQLACEVLADPARRRAPVTTRFGSKRPALRVLRGGEGR
jgi:hypothetical protein